MRLAYLMIALPALLVGIFYFVVLRSAGLEIRAAPFVGAFAAFLAALLAVRYFQRRKAGRSGR